MPNKNFTLDLYDSDTLGSIVEHRVKNDHINSPHIDPTKLNYSNTSPVNLSDTSINSVNKNKSSVTFFFNLLHIHYI